jgi:hypothetical protein
MLSFLVLLQCYHTNIAIISATATGSADTAVATTTTKLLVLTAAVATATAATDITNLFCYLHTATGRSSRGSSHVLEGLRSAAEQAVELSYKNASFELVEVPQAKQKELDYNKAAAFMQELTAEVLHALKMQPTEGGLYTVLEEHDEVSSFAIVVYCYSSVHTSVCNCIRTCTCSLCAHKIAGLHTCVRLCAYTVGAYSSYCRGRMTLRM